MPVEPQLFLSYGRPDSELAFALTAELWRNRIECYNYQVKPIMDFYGNDPDHLKYLRSIPFFVVILSAETSARKLVVEEILQIFQFCKAEIVNTPIVYVTTQKILGFGPYPTITTHYEIDPTRACGTFDRDGMEPIVKELMQLMGSELVEHCQKAWEVNKTKFQERWQRSDVILQPILAARELPCPNDIVATVLRGDTMTVLLATDLAKINDINNKWIFLLLLARLTGRFSLGTTSGELHELVPRHVQIGQVPLVRMAMHSRVEAENYRDGETIDDVASVIRAIVRIEDALAVMRSHQGLEIARRITWPATRRLLMCPIYACAAGLCDTATRRTICSELGRAVP